MGPHPHSLPALSSAPQHELRGITARSVGEVQFLVDHPTSANVGSEGMKQFAMLQEAVDRWWEPIMHFFGTDIPAEKDPSIQWGIKTRTNEESRQEWINQYVPKLWDVGVELPDPNLAYDAQAKRWTYTEPDWDRLMAIVKGDPTEATARRLYWRQVMQRNHDWIRQIVLGDSALLPV